MRTYMSEESMVESHQGEMKGEMGTFIKAEAYHGEMPTCRKVTT